MNMEAEIGPLGEEGLKTILEMAREEGWAPGYQDGQCYFAADPEGFFGAWIDGKLAGGISAVRYGANYGFIGLFIVRPEYRGGNIGLKLARKAMEHLGTRVMGEDGVLAQEKNYHKLGGFETAHHQLRYKGKAGAFCQSRPRIAAEDLPKDHTIVEVARIPSGVIGTFDALYFPGPRAAFLQSWIHAPGHVGKAILQTQMVRGHEVKTLVGYGVIRPTDQGYRIGPLFAKSAIGAREILVSLCAHLDPADDVLWDLPQPNRVACRMATDWGMEVVFETVRMYRGTPPNIAPETIFGITTFELG
jgi:GNAT superfamily N-acetyltransferase